MHDTLKTSHLVCTADLGINALHANFGLIIFKPSFSSQLVFTYDITSQFMRVNVWRSLVMHWSKENLRCWGPVDFSNQR